jgi:hypothetical protein
VNGNSNSDNLKRKILPFPNRIDKPMSNQKDENKRLEEKIDQISTQIITLSKEVKELKNAQAKESKFARKSDWALFWRGGALGIVSGLLSGLMLSYQMKIYDFLQLPWYGYVSGLIFTAFGVGVVVIIMWKISQKPPKNQNEMT